jgi:DNA topoisomerase-2
MVDGLKPGQRKILYYCLEKNLTHEIKVAQLAGAVANETDYLHGEVSLAGTIVGMAQNYVGNNNFNLLVPEGQFGTRNELGKDAGATRYIHTYLTPGVSNIFNKNDNLLLVYNDDDGRSIEPVYYVPVIPMVLINGAVGIGTGWSTTVPTFNPDDIVHNIRQFIAGKEMIKMTPWFRGFRGSVTAINNDASSEASQNYTVKGMYIRTDDCTVEVCELPVGNVQCYSFSDYKSFVENMIIGVDIADVALAKKTPKLLKDVEFLPSATSISCRLIFPSKEALDTHLSDPDKFEKTFHLTTTISTTNMNLYDQYGLIKRYDSPLHILEDFCHLRVYYYQKRKDLMIDTLNVDIDRISEKIRFIEYIFDPNHELKSHGKSRAAFTSLLDKYEFKKFSGPPKKTMANKITGDVDTKAVQSDEDSDIGTYKYLTSITFWNTTLEELERLRKEHLNLVDQRTKLELKTPSDLWSDDLDQACRDLIQFDKEWSVAYAELLSLPRKNTIIPSHMRVKMSLPSPPPPPPPPLLPSSPLTSSPIFNLIKLKIVPKSK